MFFDASTQKVQYIKRYEMRFDFTQTRLLEAKLPDGYFWMAWQPRLTEVHARIQYLGFRNELDAQIFPTFRRFDSCLRLAHQIIDSPHFLSLATWIIGKRVDSQNGVYCAAVQTSRKANNRGQLHNITVLPEFRGLGLGKALLLKSLAGFKHAGCQTVALEATAENRTAVNLYRKVGFFIVKTTFKETFIL